MGHRAEGVGEWWPLGLRLLGGGLNHAPAPANTLRGAVALSLLAAAAALPPTGCFGAVLGSFLLNFDSIFLSKSVGYL